MYALIRLFYLIINWYSLDSFPKIARHSVAAPIYEMEKHCNIEIAAQISRVSSRKNGNKFYRREVLFLDFVFFPFILSS